MESDTNDNFILFEVHPDIGDYRAYTIEPNADGWEVMLKEVTFDASGDSSDEDTILGVFSSVKDIADAVDEAEEDF